MVGEVFECVWHCNASFAASVATAKRLLSALAHRNALARFECCVVCPLDSVVTRCVSSDCERTARTLACERWEARPVVRPTLLLVHKEHGERRGKETAKAYAGNCC